MIRRVQGRGTFAALARAERHRRGPITVRAVSGDDDGPRVAYGVGREVGGAVARNRVRRRLRAAVAANEVRLDRRAAYLVSARPEALTMPFETLVDMLGVVLDSLPPTRGGGQA